MKKNKMLVFAAAALVLPLAQADDMPVMKEGLWSIRTQTSDNSGNKNSDETYTLCRNHAYDKSSQDLAKTVPGCTKMSLSVQGGKMSTEVNCVVAGTTILTKGTGTVSDTSSHSELHTTYSPAFNGMSEGTMIMDQKYLGSCPAGALPGDRTNANGSVIHLGKK